MNLNSNHILIWFNPLGPDGSFMIHESYGRNNCPEAKGLVDNTQISFLPKN